MPALCYTCGSLPSDLRIGRCPACAMVRDAEAAARIFRGDLDWDRFLELSQETINRLYEQGQVADRILVHPNTYSQLETAIMERCGVADTGAYKRLEVRGLPVYKDANVEPGLARVMTRRRFEWRT